MGRARSPTGTPGGHRTPLAAPMLVGLVGAIVALGLLIGGAVVATPGT